MAVSRLARRVFASLILGGLSLPPASAIQFNQENQDFNMVVGTEKEIAWSYNNGRSGLELAQILVNNTTSVFNDTICSNVKFAYCEYWPPPSLTTGQYILKVYDSQSYAWSPVFNITNYGNVTGPPTPTTTALVTSGATETPDDSQGDISDPDPDPDPHDLELWIPLSFGITCAIGGVAFAIYAARKQARERDIKNLFLAGKGPPRERDGKRKVINLTPVAEEGDGHPPGTLNQERHGLLSHFSRRPAPGDAEAAEAGMGSATPQPRKRTVAASLFGLFSKRKTPKATPGSVAHADDEDNEDEHSEIKRLFVFADTKQKENAGDEEAGEASSQEHEDIPLEDRPPPYADPGTRDIGDAKPELDDS